MTKQLKEATFSKLVEDLNAKWGHTYEDVKEEDLILEEAIFAGWDSKSNLVVVEELPLTYKAE